MREYKYIIFDLDGTLCDSNKAVEYCLLKTLENFNIHTHKYEIQRLLSEGHNPQDIFKRLADIKNINNVMDIYKAIYNSGKGNNLSKIYAGTYEILDILKSRDFKIILKSQKNINDMTNTLSFFRLHNYIDLCIAENEEILDRPHLDIFNEIIKNTYTDINTENILMVGDTELDIQFAKNHSIDSCWTTYGYGNVDKCLALEPTYNIESLIFLLEILDF
ncbi:HAD family hydrolase [Fluviispira vulneris]|uniref:HAD family hydrolase n=1 Tax=Fluviispira vulneris TaxID=2763012 RepID=UPI001648C62C|nr:HAD family hydrolase [Fluviispira vulneris]